MGETVAIWPPVYLGLALLVAGALAALLLKVGWGMSQWGRKTEHRVGDQMTNVRAEVVDWSNRGGSVRAGGETWRATAKETLIPGDKVVVTRVDGLTLEVKKKR